MRTRVQFSNILALWCILQGVFASAVAAQCHPHWSAANGIPGIDGPATGIAEWDPDRAIGPQQSRPSAMCSPEASARPGAEHRWTWRPVGTARTG